VSDEKQAVMEALSALGAAFMARDSAAFEEVCTPDFVFIGSTEGEEAIGRGGAVAEMFAAIEGRSEGVSFKLDWDSVDVDVAGDTAFVMCFGTATFETRFRLLRSRYRLTGILKRSGDRWLWHLHHGSEPLPW
jgi:uncharacterized protein (TIGR02246 family)